MQAVRLCLPKVTQGMGGRAGQGVKYTFLFLANFLQAPADQRQPRRGLGVRFGGFARRGEVKDERCCGRGAGAPDAMHGALCAAHPSSRKTPRTAGHRSRAPQVTAR